MLAHPDANPRREDTAERHEPHSHHGLPVAAWFILALAIAGAAWYAFPQLRRHDAAVAQFANVQKTVDSIGGQLKEADSKLQSWAGDRQELRGQIAKLSQSMETRIEAVRKQARESSEAMLRSAEERIEARLQAHLDQRIDARIEDVQARLARLESSSDTAQAQVADLRNELRQTQSEAAKQATEVSTVRSQLDENVQNHERQLASLRDREEGDRHDVNSIQRKLAARRVDFEVTKNHSRELVPGISLGVTGTNPEYRQVSGWMWVMPDRRTIWLKNQGSQEPVVFYGNADGRKRELVITNVSKNSVTGYLLLPQPSTEVAAAPAPKEGRRSE